MKRKVCKKCNKELPNDNFHKCKGGKLGTRSVCKSCCNKLNKARNKEYYQKNKKEILEKKREYYQDNKEDIKKKNKSYYYENQEKCQKEARERYEKSCPDKRRKTKLKYYHEKLKHCPENKIRTNLSRRIRDFIHKDNETTEELLGCTFEEFKTYLESMFLDGMTWENYGVHGWHIDHIIPCSSFDLSKSEEIEICFHYSNLQPLWAKDNIRKGNKII